MIATTLQLPLFGRQQYKTPYTVSSRLRITLLGSAKGVLGRTAA